MRACRARRSRPAWSTGCCRWPRSRVDWCNSSAWLRSSACRRKRAPTRRRSPPSSDAGEAPRGAESALRHLLAWMRTETGLDIGAFRRSTMLRRVARRMQINSIEDLPSYLALARADTAELDDLRRDLLASVSNFFRDPECFAALAALVPSLFEGKGPADAVRVWVPGCATGEEAYSVAMLLSEHAARLARPPRLQVFASDIDEAPIRVGSRGPVPRRHHRGRVGGAAGALLRARSRGLPDPPRTARAGAVRDARPADRRAVRASGPPVLPQPPDQPGRGSGASSALGTSISRCAATAC